jgi:UDP-N-acetylmuramyl pentapeptide synthase
VVRSCAGQPQSFEIDSRQAGEGSLFFGIPGERVDGGNFAAGVLAAGAWGVVVTPGHSEAAAAVGSGAVLEHPDPVAALGETASSHRQRLDCKVVGITGSTGKTSTKDIVTAVLSASGPTVATRGNRNTEIGMPLEILRADRETKFLVLEMAMRGKGQIAQLVRIAEPHVAVVTNIGPVHIELLGTIEAIAEAKSELIAGLDPGLTAIVPAHEPLLEPHLRSDLRRRLLGRCSRWASRDARNCERENRC